MLILFDVLTSCNKEEELYTKEALISWTGDYAADGCGFYLTIDAKTYKPENENIIGDEFKSFDSSIKVLLKFNYLDKKVIYWCGFTGQQEMDGLKIISIEKL
ncbi:MAG: hypothetical protein EHM47_09075 [Ignavibacteriales bacterium]|nr:MAG: hypothetical protein EHM47_09075 [Ignavibacteriales bacterium]